MSGNKKIHTTPKIRKFARELGANISQIQGTERKGRITEEDVKKFVSIRLGDNKQQNKLEIDFNHSDFGEVEIKEIPRIKKIAASHLVNSWQTIPHVTHHDEADVTELEGFGDVNDAFQSYFGDVDFPARSTVEVSGLPLGAMVEIECIASR